MGGRVGSLDKQLGEVILPRSACRAYSKKRLRIYIIGCAVHRIVLYLSGKLMVQADCLK